MAKKPSDQNKVLLTEEGLIKLKEELRELKEVRRREVAEKIKEASAHGDLSENAEYDEAKNDQALLEARISQLEQMIKNVEIIDEHQIKSNQIIIGSSVVLQSDKIDEKLEYTIVGAIEADPFNGKISNESPVGKALLGRKKGESVDVKTPSGIITYVIVEIQYK